jgi:hypothetical protein
MKAKSIFFLILALLPLALLCNTLIVDPSTSGCYSDIQSAVDASVPNDTVLITPGRYYENVRIISKTLTIRSSYSAFSDIQREITIVDGNQTGSCFAITDSSNVVLENLYLTNGSGFRQYTRSLPTGGGVFCSDSSLDIINCIIKNNSAYDAGGVVFYNSYAFLSGTDISFNHSYRSSAVALVTSNVVFDPVNLCSIYLNFSGKGNDISFAAQGFNIVLDKFTIENPDDEFIYSSVLEQYTLSYQSIAVEQVEADLYVSPNGDDENDGLSPNSPLKTIALAIIKVRADSLNPRIIHLADGVYSKNLNGQYLPLNMKSYLTIQGTSVDGTIIDGELKYHAAMGWNGEKDCALKNLTIRNCGSELSYGVILFNPRYYNNDDNSHTRRPRFFLENLKFVNCIIPSGNPNSETQWMAIIESRNAEEARLRNIDIQSCRGSYAINIQGGNTYAENILIDDYSFGNYQCAGVPIAIGRNSYYDYNEDANYFVNVRITNCRANDNSTLTSSMFAVSNSLTGNQTPIETYLINSTISNNLCRNYYGSAVFLKQNGRLTLINSIINHNRPNNIRLDAPSDEPSRLRVLNSLIHNETSMGYTNIVNFGINNIQEWYGTNLDTLPDFNFNNASNPYLLNQTSPCIDAGTTDFSVLSFPQDFSLPLIDLDGNPRIYGSQIDMGAYEWNGTGSGEDTLPVLSDGINLSLYPNPVYANGSKGSYSFIEFTLPVKAKQPPVAEVYDLKGRRVRSLTISHSYNDLVKKAGLSKRVSSGGEFYSTVFDCRDERGGKLASGIYIIRVMADGREKAGKLTILR